MISADRLKAIDLKGFKEGDKVQISSGTGWQSSPGDELVGKCPDGYMALTVNIDGDFYEKIGKPKRARKKSGQYQADDPDTPDTNEAYEGGKAPKKAKKKASKKKSKAS